MKKKILGKNILGREDGRYKGPKVGENAVNQILEKSRKRKGAWQGRCWARTYEGSAPC